MRAKRVMHMMTPLRSEAACGVQWPKYVTPDGQYVTCEKCLRYMMEDMPRLWREDMGGDKLAPEPRQ